MSLSSPKLDELLKRIAELEEENGHLRHSLAKLSQHTRVNEHHNDSHPPAASPPVTATTTNSASETNSSSSSLSASPFSSSAGDVSSFGLSLHGLSNVSIARYGRQLILPEFGALGQKILCSSSVLIVGCGGLGAPCAMYLASCGIGRLGLVDGDRVEMNNLHRQIIHQEQAAKSGISKVLSAANSCRALNSQMRIDCYPILLSAKNALEMIEKYDAVLDCTDNVVSRYVINDVCMALKKPLISASALRMEGQLTVYGFPFSSDTPCYRCIFPQPPPAITVTNCSDGGVLGVITGVLGTLQALECIKVLLQQHSAQQFQHFEILSKRLLLFDGAASQFRTVKLRPKRADCPVCGESPKLNLNTIPLFDYHKFCDALPNDAPMSCPAELQSKANAAETPNISVTNFAKLTSVDRLLIDVREPHQFAICHLPDAINFPLRIIARDLPSARQQIQQWHNDRALSSTSVFLMCRRGIDSVSATKLLNNNETRRFAKDSDESKEEKSLPDRSEKIEEPQPISLTFVNVEGGLVRWTKEVDPQFPVY